MQQKSLCGKSILQDARVLEANLDYAMSVSQLNGLALAEDLFEIALSVQIG